MKVKIEQHGQYSEDGIIVLSKKVLQESGLKVGQEATIDVPMVGGGLVVHPVEQRVGEEVV